MLGQTQAGLPLSDDASERELRDGAYVEDRLNHFFPTVRPLVCWLRIKCLGQALALTCVGKGVLFMEDLFICLFMYVVLGMVPRTSHIVDKPSITELRFQPLNAFI